MPTRPSEILKLLQTKQGDFQDFDQTTLKLLQKYRQAFQQLATLNPGLNWVVEPLSGTVEGLISFNQQWTNREESLHWVRDRLTGVKTFSVDGSQIYPSKDLSVPVALVQIGWFENHHEPGGCYEKDVRLDLLTPTDLRDHLGELADRRVNMRRFEMETGRLYEYIVNHDHDPDCLVLLDGSLVATFAEAFDQTTQNFYVNCLVDLLRASALHRVPLVAYVDTSYARDLTQVLQSGFNLPEVKSIHDAQVIGTRMKWGDRTPLMRCQREILSHLYRDQADRVGFTYLKTHDGYPARLEIPLWIAEAGRLEEVLDWVRGEVAIGNGYPYAIETADQVAVLQTDDRQTFYRILQDWIEEEGLHLRFSRKMVSKVRRRYT